MHSCFGKVKPRRLKGKRIYVPMGFNLIRDGFSQLYTLFVCLREQHHKEGRPLIREQPICSVANRHFDFHGGGNQETRCALRTTFAPGCVPNLPSMTARRGGFESRDAPGRM